MKFIETELKGSFIIELEPIEDDRGFFARSFCQKEFKKQGLNSDIVQCNISYNLKCGTLRGMHFQIEPYSETKVVSCVKGSIYDVIIDLRKDSKTYLKWVSVVLSEENKKMLYIPENFAHGFQTLENNTYVYYQMGHFYKPEAAYGIRYNDPLLNICWPLEHKIISEKDISYKDFQA